MLKRVPVAAYIVANAGDSSSSHEFGQVFKLQEQGIKIGTVSVVFIKSDSRIDTIE